MKLQVREIVAAMPGLGEPVTGSMAEKVTSLAQPIKLRDVLEEMHMSESAAINDQAVLAVEPKAGRGRDKSPVVPLAVPQARTLRRQWA